ncbi:hypothetical protein J3E68DRAFT_289179 [Trichoderma sp. SZMC 28012]
MPDNMLLFFSASASAAALTKGGGSVSRWPFRLFLDLIPLRISNCKHQFSRMCIITRIRVTYQLPASNLFHLLYFSPAKHLLPLKKPVHIRYAQHPSIHFPIPIHTIAFSPFVIFDNLFFSARTLAKPRTDHCRIYLIPSWPSDE